MEVEVVTAMAAGNLIPSFVSFVPVVRSYVYFQQNKAHFYGKFHEKWYNSRRYCILYPRFVLLMCLLVH